MRPILTAFLTVLLLSGCSTGIKVYKSPPTEKAVNVKQAEKKQAKANKSFDKGMSFYAQGKYHQAIKMLTKSISANPDNWKAYYYLGLCQQKTKRYDRSLVTFNNSLKYGPADKLIIAEINYLLGISWEKTGYADKARSKYSYALRLNPDLTEARLALKRIEIADAKNNKGKKKDLRGF